MTRVSRLRPAASLSLASYLRQPRLSPVGVDRDIEQRRFDQVDRPANREGAPQLRIGNPAGAPVAGLTIAETHHVVHATRPKGRTEALDKDRALFVVEDVEDPTVGNHVEKQPELLEMERIRDLEGRPDAALFRLGSSTLDRKFGDVDSPGVS